MPVLLLLWQTHPTSIDKLESYAIVALAKALLGVGDAKFGTQST